jgi:rieske iron-sulfur protein
MVDSDGGFEQGVALVSRRAAICGVCAAAAIMTWMPGPADAGEAADPARDALAQPGDLLVAFKNDGAGAIINPADVKRDAQPLLAWPFDPAKKIARDGSRLNLVILMAFDPSSLSAAERARAAHGIVAYTAVCTHMACWVTDWLNSKQVLQCACHQSEYDPRQGGRVVSGPAPRPLPALPLRVVEGRLEVKAPFTDRIGGEKVTG